MQILKNGKIIPMVGEPCEGDIAIENGKIHAMGVNLDYPNAEEINVSGCFVLPGFVDAHCHIGMWEDGSSSSTLAVGAGGMPENRYGGST